MVRVSPTLRFPFCDPAFSEQLASRGQQPPTTAVSMPPRQFALRLQRCSYLAPVHYGPGEAYYLQADIPGSLLQDVQGSDGGLTGMRSTALYDLPDIFCRPLECQAPWHPLCNRQSALYCLAACSSPAFHKGCCCYKQVLLGVLGKLSI